MSNIELPNGFTPRDYQMPVWDYMIQDKEGLRASMVWHRRGGKDLTSVALCSVKAFQRVGTYWHVLPTYKQGRKIIWDGIRGDGVPFLDSFPSEIVSHKDKVEMKLELTNGSKYYVVGSDNVDTLVGTNPVGVVFSEYSLQDPAAWDYIRPILAENGGWALFIFTPRGKNHGYRLHRMAESNPKWFASTLTINDTKAVTQETIDEERLAGMTEELVQQEFFCSWTAPLTGAYYSKQMEDMLREDRIGIFPWEPRLEVHTWWDLGIDDCTSIGFFQFLGQEIRMIDYLEDSGEGLVYYAKKLKEKNYVYGRHYAPWDIEVREFTSGKSRRETAAGLGIKFDVVRKHSIEDGIEATRNILPRVFINEPNCERAIEAMRSYRKEFDDKNKTYKSTPVHDWASHCADMFRQMAMTRQPKRNRGKAPQQTAIDDYDYC